MPTAVSCNGSLFEINPTDWINSTPTSCLDSDLSYRGIVTIPFLGQYGKRCSSEIDISTASATNSIDSIVYQFDPESAQSRDDFLMNPEWH